MLRKPNGLKKVSISECVNASQSCSHLAQYLQAQYLVSSHRKLLTSVKHSPMFPHCSIASGVPVVFKCFVIILQLCVLFTVFSDWVYDFRIYLKFRLPKCTLLLPLHLHAEMSYLTFGACEYACESVCVWVCLCACCVLIDVGLVLMSMHLVT